MPRRLAGLAGDRSGASAIVIGLSMTVLLGFVGLAVDAGVWYADRRAAQGAADSAAYTAAIDIAAGDSVTGARTAAKAITAQYGLTDGSGGVTVTVNSPPTTGPRTSTTGAVEVIVKKTESLFFSQFSVSSAQVSARAVAVAGSTGGKYCVLALDPGSGVDVNAQNGAVVNLTACGIQVNGTGSGALTVVGGAVINACTVSVVGGITTNNGGAVNATCTKTTGAPALPDPYASVAMPTPKQTCDFTSANYNGGGQTYTINPGTYCSGLSVSNGVTVTMNPGIYIIKGGVFNLQSGTVKASGGVTIVLTGSGSNYATMSIGNNMNFTLTAPSTGPTAGLAVFQDRSAPTSGVNPLAGGTTTIITGALYFPHQTVNLSNNTSNNSSCTQLVAYDILFTGSAKFTNNCGGTGVVGIGAAATSLAE